MGEASKMRSFLDMVAAYALIGFLAMFPLLIVASLAELLWRFVLTPFFTLD
jgi:hypothetical protein